MQSRNLALVKEKRQNEERTKVSISIELLAALEGNKAARELQELAAK